MFAKNVQLIYGLKYLHAHTFVAIYINVSIINKIHQDNICLYGKDYIYQGLDSYLDVILTRDEPQYIVDEIFKCGHVLYI